MPHALVGPAEHVVHRPAIVEDHEILEPHAQREPAGPQPGGLVERDEGAGRRQFVAIRLGRDPDREGLPADGPRAVVEFVVDRETRKPRRRGLDPRGFVAHATGLGHHQRIGGGAEPLHARLGERLDEGQRRTVEPRQLLGIDPHDAAVDPQAGQRAEGMLHHLQPPARHREIRPGRRLHTVLDRGGNPHRHGTVGSHEDDARARRRRQKLDAHRTAAPVPHAGDGGRAADRLLGAHENPVRRKGAREDRPRRPSRTRSASSTGQRTGLACAGAAATAPPLSIRRMSGVMSIWGS